MEQNKNFSVRLKASVDRRMKELNIWDMILSACDNYEHYEKIQNKFFYSLDTITLIDLQGGCPIELPTDERSVAIGAK